MQLQLNQMRAEVSAAISGKGALNVEPAKPPMSPSLGVERPLSSPPPGHGPGATLNPQPSTLNPQPSTLNPQPSTLNPQPLSPQPSTLSPQPSTLNSTT